MADPIQVSVEGDVARAELAGDFDMAATFTVEPALERALEEPGVDALELDLSNLRFIDSTGIGVLLRLVAEADRRGIDALDDARPARRAARARGDGRQRRPAVHRLSVRPRRRPAAPSGGGGAGRR